MKSLAHEHISNLRKLAEYLSGGSRRMSFDMLAGEVVGHTYSVGDIEDEIHDIEAEIHLGPDKAHLGDIASALGHGPDATGIPGLPGESWHAYSKRVFGLSKRDGTKHLYNWCFDDMWVHVDNTPEGVGKRILFLLNTVRYGGCPICYDYSRFKCVF